MKIGKEFYLRDALTVAKDLLGKVIVRTTKDGIIKSRIVEVEAYTGEKDKACHTYGGRKTPRTSIMYKEGGYIYVYLIYGMYSLMNIVTGGEENGEAVLIRAIEPLNDLDIFSRNRFGKAYKDLTSYQRKNLTSGPGKLTKAILINRNDNGKDLFGEEIYLEDDGYKDFEFVESKRIGIDYAEEAREFLYRFYIKGNPNVSVQ